MLGEFSGVCISAGRDLPFAVPWGLPPSMAYFQVIGTFDSFIVFWV